MTNDYIKSKKWANTGICNIHKTVKTSWQLILHGKNLYTFQFTVDDK